MAWRTRWQAIIWNNDAYIVHWRIYASSGLNGLISDNQDLILNSILIRVSANIYGTTRRVIRIIENRVMMTSSNGNIFRVTGPLCGEFTGPGEFPTQRPVTRSFDVFFDLRLNKRLSKQPWGWWFETLSWSLWRHRNGTLTPRLTMGHIAQQPLLGLLSRYHSTSVYPLKIRSWNLWMVDLQIDGLIQGRRNSVANALDLRLSCTNPSKSFAVTWLKGLDHQNSKHSNGRQGDMFYNTKTYSFDAQSIPIMKTLVRCFTLYVDFYGITWQREPCSQKGEYAFEFV